MNKVPGIILMAVIAVGVVSYAHGHEERPLPPGVAADHWIAMGDSAGFVITKADNDLENGYQNKQNVLRGYLVVRLHDAWIRADASPQYGAQRAVFER